MTGIAALRADFAALSEIGRRAEGGWARPGFGPGECAAHEWFLDRARAAGLWARTDAFGNAIARLGGEGAAIALGSHLDTVVGGGAFDGALGVLAGLEIARRIAATGGLACPLEVIAFRDEEGRFAPFPGSRAMTGTLPVGDIPRLRAADGAMLVDAMLEAGFDPAAAGQAARGPGALRAYLELHIEQGPVLERAGVPVGIVTAIAGQERLSLRFTGRPDHAGTTPMEMRRDAFAAAARFADRFRDLILSDPSPSLRGTVGVVKVTPNQGNVVPGEVRMGLEIRDTDAEAVERAARAAEALAAEAARATGCEARARSLHRDDPVVMDAGLRAALAQAARDLGIPAMDLPSGAGHDAGVLARHVPAAMIFVPSEGGRSHCPEEHTGWPPVEQAVAVLERTVRRLGAAP